VQARFRRFTLRAPAADAAVMQESDARARGVMMALKSDFESYGACGARLRLEAIRCVPLLAFTPPPRCAIDMNADGAPVIRFTYGVSV